MSSATRSSRCQEGHGGSFSGLTSWFKVYSFRGENRFVPVGHRHVYEAEHEVNMVLQSLGSLFGVP